MLATRAALGDRGAFADIVRRHGPSMYRYALRMLDGDHQGAEDAVQDALTDAWVNLPGFRHESALHTWLFRIGANRVLSERRRRRPGAVDDRLLSTQPEPSYRGPAQRAEHEHLWESLDLALTELPWRQRASWILRELEGLSYAEIAQILHTTPTVVRAGTAASCSAGPGDPDGAVAMTPPTLPTPPAHPRSSAQTRQQTRPGPSNRARTSAPATRRHWPRRPRHCVNMSTTGGSKCPTGC